MCSVVRQFPQVRVRLAREQNQVVCWLQLCVREARTVLQTLEVQVQVTRRAFSLFSSRQLRVREVIPDQLECADRALQVVQRILGA